MADNGIQLKVFELAVQMLAETDERFGMSRAVAMSRLLDFFAACERSLQEAILDACSQEAEAELTRRVLDHLAKGK